MNGRFLHLSLIGLVWLSCFSRIHSQDLTLDRDFFEVAAMKDYQAWLETSGIGKVLSVRKVQVKEQELTLFLEFYSTDDDICRAQWNQLKQDFAEKNKAISLAQQLFYKMVSVLDAPQRLANIKIYDVYTKSQPYCLFIDIRFRNGKVMLTEDFYRCKDEKRFVQVNAIPLDGLKDETKALYKEGFSKTALFNLILEYANGKYKNICGDTEPVEITLLERDQVLRFRVDDLCKEILKGSRNPWYCRIFDCNYITRERITFTITFTELKKGILLGIEIDGRYSSGYYRDVGRHGFHPMDDNFKQDLVDYADIVKLEIQEKINQHASQLIDP